MLYNEFDSWNIMVDNNIFFKEIKSNEVVLLIWI